MLRLLILCTHNSARSQMGEGIVRQLAQQLGLELEVLSAGTEATFVKDGAIEVMKEIGVDLSGHISKTLHDVPDPQRFDYVITVCDSANEACPVYSGQIKRRHYPFRDPSGQDLEQWRRVRDQMRTHFETALRELAAGRELPASYEGAPQ